MRISDWSSDVCSSDLQFRSLIVVIPASAAGFGVRGVDDAGEDRRTVARRVAPAQDIGAELGVLVLGEVGAGRHRIDADLNIDAGQHLGDRLADRSEEHTSELQSLMSISYAVFCLKKKKN